MSRNQEPLLLGWRPSPIETKRITSSFLLLLVRHLLLVAMHLFLVASFAMRLEAKSVHFDRVSQAAAAHATPVEDAELQGTRVVTPKVGLGKTSFDQFVRQKDFRGVKPNLLCQKWGVLWVPGHASSNKCLTSSSRCLTSSNKKLLETSANKTQRDAVREDLKWT